MFPLNEAYCVLCLIVISVDPEEAEEGEEGEEEAAGGVGFWVEEETAGGESAQTLYRWPETNLFLFFHFLTPLLSSCISPTSDSYSRPTVWFTVVHSAFLCKLTAHEAKLTLAKLKVDSRVCAVFQMQWFLRAKWRTKSRKTLQLKVTTAVTLQKHQQQQTWCWHTQTNKQCITTDGCLTVISIHKRSTQKLNHVETFWSHF